MIAVRAVAALVALWSTAAYLVHARRRLWRGFALWLVVAVVAIQVALS